MESGQPIPIYGRGIFTTEIRCKRRDLNVGQQFFQYPGFDPQLLAIAASSAMIAAPSSVNHAAVSSSRRNRASCQSRRRNTASRAVATRANACRSRACLRRRYHVEREIPSAISL